MIKNMYLGSIIDELKVSTLRVTYGDVIQVCTKISEKNLVCNYSEDSL